MSICKRGRGIGVTAIIVLYTDAAHIIDYSSNLYSLWLLSLSQYVDCKFAIDDALNFLERKCAGQLILLFS